MFNTSRSRVSLRRGCIRVSLRASDISLSTETGLENREKKESYFIILGHIYRILKVCHNFSLPHFILNRIEPGLDFFLKLSTFFDMTQLSYFSLKDLYIPSSKLFLHFFPPGCISSDNKAITIVPGPGNYFPLAAWRIQEREEIQPTGRREHLREHLSISSEVTGWRKPK